MTRLLLVLMILPLTATAADDPRFSYLEQEVRNLQRQMQVLGRQLDEIRNRPDLPASQGAAPMPAAADPELPRWVDAALWRKIAPGMSELEVISSLGAPTTMREVNGSRVLLYAMEIGSGFLGGSVKLQGRAVVEVQKPTLQ